MHIRKSVFFHVDLWQMINKRILFILCSFVFTTLHAAPRIACDAPKYDFGTKITGKPIVHQFTLVNRGDEPLKIGKIKNCCGVESTVDPMVIPPGSKAVCTATFTTKNRYGKQDKQILLVTNDKKNLYFDLRMTGTLLKSVELKPRWVRLGKLLSDGTVSESITAENLSDETVTLDSVSITVPGLEAEIVNPEDCRVGMVEDLPAAGSEKAGRSLTVLSLQKDDDPVRSWTIQLKSSGPLPVGKLNGQIKLDFSTGEIKIPVLGEVLPVIQITPEKISLGSSDSSVERLVMLRSGDGRDFEVLSAQLQNANGAVSTKRLGPDKWQCKVQLDPSEVKSGASVQIKTSVNPDAVIEVPICRQISSPT